MMTKVSRIVVIEINSANGSPAGRIDIDVDKGPSVSMGRWQVNGLDVDPLDIARAIWGAGIDAGKALGRGEGSR